MSLQGNPNPGADIHLRLRFLESKYVVQKRSQKYMVMKFDVFEGEVCGGKIFCGNIFLSIFPRKIFLKLSPKLHHNLHTEVRNNQRNLSPSARSVAFFLRTSMDCCSYDEGIIETLHCTFNAELHFSEDRCC